MCLITEQKEPSIAKEDMVVFKILNDRCESIYQNFKYVVDRQYATKIEKDEYDSMAFDAYETSILEENYKDNWEWDHRLTSYGQGFHASLTAERLQKVLDHKDGIAFEEGGVIWKCIIPAGSEYYTSLTGLIVSDNIIVKEKV